MKLNWTDEQQIAMRRLYGQFVKPGNLVFNVGANIGTRTQVFVELGAKVIALEPQPDLARILRERYRENKAVTIIEAAAGPQMGAIELMVCTDNVVPLATAEPNWIRSVEEKYCKNWPMENWNQTIVARQITLDSLVECYGVPDFVKIDVDGYERFVLQGLSYKPATVCFEVTLPYGDPAIMCVADLSSRLGYTEFNYLVQEDMKLVFDKWVDAQKMIAVLKALPMRAFFVDVFAR